MNPRAKNVQDPLYHVLHNLGEELEELYGLFIFARDNEWSRPQGKIEVEPEEPGTHEVASNGRIRPKNKVSDPTGDIVVDDARMLLRRRLTETERDLQRVYADLRGVRSRLGSALRPWDR